MWIKAWTATEATQNMLNLLWSLHCIHASPFHSIPHARQCLYMYIPALVLAVAVGLGSWTLLGSSDSLGTLAVLLGLEVALPVFDLVAGFAVRSVTTASVEVAVATGGGD